METVFFECRAIETFLTHNNFDWKKYNELMAAFVMSKVYAAGTNMQDAPIGFAVKSDAYRRLTSEQIDFERLSNVINNMKEDNTPIDMIISPYDIDHIPLRNFNSRAWSFQIKRFIERPGDDPTEKLIQYLNVDIKKKYSKVNSRLLILFELVQNLNLVKVADSFDPTNFPFTHVQFISFDFIDQEKIEFGDIWPERHLYRGSIYNLFEYGS